MPTKLAKAFGTSVAVFVVAVILGSIVNKYSPGYSVEMVFASAGGAGVGHFIGVMLAMKGE